MPPRSWILFLLLVLSLVAATAGAETMRVPEAPPGTTAVYVPRDAMPRAPLTSAELDRSLGLLQRAAAAESHLPNSGARVELQFAERLMALSRERRLEIYCLGSLEEGPNNTLQKRQVVFGEWRFRDERGIFRPETVRVEGELDAVVGRPGKPNELTIIESKRTTPDSHQAVKYLTQERATQVVFAAQNPDRISRTNNVIQFLGETDRLLAATGTGRRSEGRLYFTSLTDPTGTGTSGFDAAVTEGRRPRGHSLSSHAGDNALEQTYRERRTKGNIAPVPTLDAMVARRTTAAAPVAPPTAPTTASNPAPAPARAAAPVAPHAAPPVVRAPQQTIETPIRPSNPLEDIPEGPRGHALRGGAAWRPPYIMSLATQSSVAGISVSGGGVQLLEVVTANDRRFKLLTDQYNRGQHAVECRDLLRRSNVALCRDNDRTCRVRYGRLHFETLLATNWGATRRPLVTPQTTPAQMETLYAEAYEEAILNLCTRAYPIAQRYFPVPFGEANNADRIECRNDLLTLANLNRFEGNLLADFVHPLRVQFLYDTREDKIMLFVPNGAGFYGVNRARRGNVVGGTSLEHDGFFTLKDPRGTHYRLADFKREFASCFTFNEPIVPAGVPTHSEPRQAEAVEIQRRLDAVDSVLHAMNCENAARALPEWVAAVESAEQACRTQDASTAAANAFAQLTQAVNRLRPLCGSVRGISYSLLLENRSARDWAKLALEKLGLSPDKLPQRSIRSFSPAVAGAWCERQRDEGARDKRFSLALTASACVVRSRTLTDHPTQFNDYFHAEVRATENRVTAAKFEDVKTWCYNRLQILRHQVGAAQEDLKCNSITLVGADDRGGLTDFLGCRVGTSDELEFLDSETTQRNEKFAALMTCLKAIKTAGTPFRIISNGAVTSDGVACATHIARTYQTAVITSRDSDLDATHTANRHEYAVLNSPVFYYTPASPEVELRQRPIPGRPRPGPAAIATH